MAGADLIAALSARARALQASQIRAVAECGMARYDDVAPLWFGEGAWPTNPMIVDAAVASLKAGDHFYSPNNGDVALRDAIVSYTNDLYGTGFDRRRVTVANSGLQALVLTADLLTTAGDRVVTIGPNWPNIPGAFAGRDAEVIDVALAPRNGKWTLDMDTLLAALTPETKAVVVNSPHNPTGWTMTAEEQRTLLDHCRQHGIWIVADDVYARLYRWGDAAPSFLEIADADDRLITVNSFSKAWSMTGWRLGWIVAPAAVEEKLGQLNEFNSSCSPAFIQAAGRVAIENSNAIVADLRAKIAAGYAIAAERLRAFDRVDFVEPDGAFYAFFKVRDLEDSYAGAMKILEETKVGLAPGVAFGVAGEGHLRLCYARPADDLERAFDRLATFLHG
ncbi:MAG: pyridoxal phosphate-dependent aminotransferase [Pseudomonadota bacterium]